VKGRAALVFAAIRYSLGYFKILSPLSRRNPPPGRSACPFLRQTRSL